MFEHAAPDPTPATARFSAAIPPDGRGLSRLRRRIHGWLAARGVDGTADGAVLLANELVTNVRRHAPGAARLRLFLRPALLRCEVQDAHPTRPRLVRSSCDDEAGRGLALVDSVAARWGHTFVRSGKVVWFDLPMETVGADCYRPSGLADVAAARRPRRRAPGAGPASGARHAG